MGTRTRLPSRRPAETFELVAGGLKYTCTVGRFPDGRLAELFLTNHKAGSHADTAARDSAITFSIAVKHGADPRPSATRSVAMPTARRAVPSGSRSNSARKDREFVR